MFLYKIHLICNFWYDSPTLICFWTTKGLQGFLPVSKYKSCAKTSNGYTNKVNSQKKNLSDEKAG